MASKTKEALQAPSDNHKAKVSGDRIPEEVFGTIPDENTDQAPDPFNIDDIRVPQNYEAGVKADPQRVGCHKPKKKSFFRVRPGREWALDVYLYTDEATRTSYLVLSRFWDEVGDVAKHVRLRLCITRQGSTFLWPLNLTNPDAPQNEWNDSAMRVAQTAENTWVRIVSNRDEQSYEARYAARSFPEPEWPNYENILDVVKLAFRGRVIDHENHEVLQELRGEV